MNCAGAATGAGGSTRVTAQPLIKAISAAVAAAAAIVVGRARIGAVFVDREPEEIKDVRLVQAPADGIGNFGGEIDNWQWPRHAGDYAFFRAYVGKDGKPAEYANDNVPYHPRPISSSPNNR